MDEKKSSGDEAFKAGQHAQAVDFYGECLQLLHGAVRAHRHCSSLPPSLPVGSPSLSVLVFACEQGQGKKALSSKIYLNRATARSKIAGQSQLEEAVRDCNAALAINASYLKVSFP